jgi:phosphohistidine phosphatase
MKTLYLLRHAKSSWSNPGLTDFERPLMETGIKRTKRIIKFLKEKEIMIDLIKTSPAVRTLETAKLVAAGINYPIRDIWKEKPLYEAGVEDFVNVIRETGDEAKSLMVVGHNFTISNVAQMFLGPSTDIMPTSGLVGISFDTDHWEDITSAETEQLFFIHPKMLK